MARSEFPENPPERKFRLPANPHPLYSPPCPKQMGMHPVKDSAQAGGAGYKLVSRSPFKRYSHEDARLPLNTLTVVEVSRQLHSSEKNTVRKAAMELNRRRRNGRDLSRLSQNDWDVLNRFFPPQKGKAKRNRIF